MYNFHYVLKNEARKINHQEVVEEDRKKKEPANYETKRKWAERKLEEEKKRTVGCLHFHN